MCLNKSFSFLIIRPYKVGGTQDKPVDRIRLSLQSCFGRISPPRNVIRPVGVNLPAGDSGRSGNKQVQTWLTLVTRIK